jgi:hypothetical protein
MHENLIPLAQSIAALNPRDYKHVSLVVKQGKILAVGTNIFKGHTEAVRRGYTFPEPHSELRAYMRVPYTQRDKITLVNFRFNKRGELRMSKPCVNCLPWVSTVFKKVYYSTNEGMVQL